jgi:hypothetical protein
MCMVVYIAAGSPLPLVPWQEEEPAFNVTELTEHEAPVRRHLALPHVRQAGSHTSCGCGFNEGREYPEVYDDPAAERAQAIASSSRLARYVIEHGVAQIYSCWSGDEGEPQVFERRITPDALVVEEFYFRERELLIIVTHDPA